MNKRHSDEHTALDWIRQVGHVQVDPYNRVLVTDPSNPPGIAVFGAIDFLRQFGWRHATVRRAERP